MSERDLHGWGRTTPVRANVLAPSSEDELLAILAREPAVIARGLGRSYGDAAQVAGGVVVDLRAFNDIGAIDEKGRVRVGAGVSFDELIARVLPEGWFVPVTPGTRQVTMGGAIAADVHGKNHHRDGSMAAHVSALRLVAPSGVYDLTPEETPELFWASFGAMGLTGVVTELTLQLIRVESDRVLVDTDRYDDLESVMAAMVSGDDDYHYSVAWVDCMTRGRHLGRAILTRGEHAARADLDGATLRAPAPQRLHVPVVAPRGLLNRYSVRAFNEAWFRAAPRHERAAVHSIGRFFHPLDGVGDWNRLYGPRGFVQYQFVVPDESSEVVRRAITHLAESRATSFLAVLKRFGAANPAPLSFPRAGWTLALDLPLGSRSLAGVLDQLDEMVVAAGGRIYLAKDARLRASHVAAMYPRLEEFREITARLDPRGVLTSDLARRLHLVGT